MVKIDIENNCVVLKIKGLHKLWAFKNSIRVPKGNIRNVRRSPEGERGLYMGLRLPGTHIPGIIIAGTYHSKGVRSFWDVTSRKNTIAIDLEGGPYDKLVVDVEDPDRAISMINNAIGDHASGS